MSGQKGQATRIHKQEWWNKTCFIYNQEEKWLQQSPCWRHICCHMEDPTVQTCAAAVAAENRDFFSFYIILPGKTLPQPGACLPLSLLLLSVWAPCVDESAMPTI